MRAWVGLLLFALAFIVGAFGVAVLAAEWRDDDINRLSDDVAELRDEVRDLRAELKLDGTPSPSPTPSPTPEPIALAAEVGASVELRGMRLTMTTLAPQRSAGSAGFTLENLEAPAADARPASFEWKAVSTSDFICDVNAQAPDVSLSPGEKVSFTVSWACPSPTRSLNVDNVAFTLPIVPRASSD
jgi:hypothetical protein